MNLSVFCLVEFNIIIRFENHLKPKSVTEDPWVFNFLGQSQKPGTTLEVSFCVFD